MPDIFAVERSLPQQKGAAHAARHAVIPAGQRRIDYQFARSPWMLSPGVICRCNQNYPCESICDACLLPSWGPTLIEGFTTGLLAHERSVSHLPPASREHDRLVGAIQQDTRGARAGVA